jgi:hypothetical protein
MAERNRTYCSVISLISASAACRYYPKSLQDLPRVNPAWQKYRYETNELTAVLAAPGCEQKRKEVSGRVFFGDTYKTWQAEFVRQCIRGYSRFVLKSERLGTKWGINRSTVVFAKFMSATGVRRDKAALSSGCKPHPAIAPAGSNRSSHGGNEVAEAFD